MGAPFDRFKIVTDQRSVVFMYSNANHGKIKNDKVLRWRMELSEFDFDVAYRTPSTEYSIDDVRKVV